MRGAARTGDLVIGTCYNLAAHLIPIPSTGTIITGSPDTMANGRMQARTGDVVIWHCCGAVSHIIGSAVNSITNGQIKAVQGDSVVGMGVGTICVVSPNYFGG